jgi:hypothetical protein
VGGGLRHPPHRIEEDVDSGARSGVEETPTSFLNGLRHEDVYDAEALLAALSAAGVDMSPRSLRKVET